MIGSKRQLIMIYRSYIQYVNYIFPKKLSRKNASLVQANKKQFLAMIYCEPILDGDFYVKHIWVVTY